MTNVEKSINDSMTRKQKGERLDKHSPFLCLLSELDDYLEHHRCNPAKY